MNPTVWAARMPDTLQLNPFWRLSLHAKNHLRACAEALRITLESMPMRVEGDIDLRGFFAVDVSVRAGFRNVRGTSAAYQQRKRCRPCPA